MYLCMNKGSRTSMHRSQWAQKFKIREIVKIKEIFLEIVSKTDCDSKDQNTSLRRSTL